MRFDVDLDFVTLAHLSSPLGTLLLFRASIAESRTFLFNYATDSFLRENPGSIRKQIGATALTLI